LMYLLAMVLTSAEIRCLTRRDQGAGSGRRPGLCGWLRQWPSGWSCQTISSFGLPAAAGQERSLIPIRSPWRSSGCKAKVALETSPSVCCWLWVWF